VTTGPIRAERWLGGSVGIRAERAGVWFSAGPWVMLIGTLNWLLLMVRQVPCLQGSDPYRSMCYSDVIPLYYHRGLLDGQVPFLQADLEYPVLTGAVMEVARRLVTVLGGRSEPGLSGDEHALAASLFFGATALLMFAFFVVLIWAHLRLSRPWDAMMIAASPAVLTTGLINWDMMVIALTSLALLSWSQRKPVWTGIWIGLGVAAKLYPALLLVPLAVLCFRTARLRPFFITTAAALGSWVAVNLPVYLANPPGWLYFWTFNVERGAELGSLWYVLTLAGYEIEGLSRLISVLMVIGTAVICLILLLAPRRPRLAQGFFLLVVLFLVLNKVYSPQYVLWLLPVLVLARPRWREWIAFGVAETLYFGAIWGHLAGTLTPGSGGPDRLYWASVVLRVAVQVILAGRVIWDMFRAQDDPVRAGGADDPDGGFLDGAADAPWLSRLPWRH
jgi:uncharacterized membrane protein